MKATPLIFVFILTIGLFNDLIPVSSVDTSQTTGLNSPNPAQEAWMKQNFRIVQGVKMNQIAFERINQERAAKGLERLKGDEADLAPIGEELDFSGVQPQAITSMLPSVDNSISIYFPPIRSQGSIGSCVAWCTTYYQFTYETNLAKGRAANSGDNLNIFSPKWTYNFINFGQDGGAYFSDAYNVLIKHGAASWAAFPYDTNYLAWPTSSSTYREAINYRPQTWGQIYNSDTNQVISAIKTQLANGHIIVIGTYVNSWVQTSIKDDLTISTDNPFVGQKIASYMKNTNQGGHGMTLVGYNDDLWCDMNGNGLVESAEKGAFKIANSWGTSDWNLGYRWVTYDSLRGASAVPAAGSWPTVDRYSAGIFRGSDIYTMTVSADYTPKLVAEFTLNQAKRSQLNVGLGIGDQTSITPSSTWSSEALSYSGGNWAFDGTSTTCDASFYLDFTDLTPSSTAAKRWFLAVGDSAAGSVTTIKSLRLHEVGTTGDVLVGSSVDVPKSVDGGSAYLWVDYTYYSGNSAPTAVISADPLTGAPGLTVHFNGQNSFDTDGSIKSYIWDFGDGMSATTAPADHTYSKAGTFTAKLTVTDDKDASGSATVVITISDPNYLNPPTNLMVRASDRVITLTWKDNSINEAGFIVERGVKSKSSYSWTTIKETLADTISYTYNVPSSGTYYYRVKAYNSEYIYSVYSNQVSIRIR